MATPTSHDSHDHDHEHAHAHEAHGASDACCATPAGASAGVDCCAGAMTSLLQLDEPVASAEGTQTPIRIMQMDCPTEEGLIRKKLGGMPGVAGMDFNLMQRVLTVTHEPKAIEG